MTTSTSPAISTRKILSAGLMVSLGILLGRIVGFFRDLVLAKSFGVSESADLAVLLLTLPDSIMALFIGGAANIVFIPLFQKVDKENKFSYFSTLSLLLFIFFSIVSLILLAFVPQLAKLLAPGLSTISDLVEGNLAIVLFAVPIASLTAVSRAYLQAEYKFFWTMLETFIYNCIVILMLWFFVDNMGVKSILFGIYLGAIAKWLSQVIYIGRAENISFKLLYSHSILNRGLFISYAQSLGAGLIIVSLPIIARSFGSHIYGAGAVSIVDYAYKIVEVPFGVFVSVFAVTLFPKLSQMFIHNQNNLDAPVGFMKNSVRFLLSSTVPLSLSLAALFVGLKSYGLSTRNISADAIIAIETLAVIGFLLMPIRGLSLLHVTILSALKDTRSPLIVNLIGLFVAFPIFYFITRYVGLFGVGIALCLVCIIIFILECLIMHFKHGINVYKDIFDKKTLRVLLINFAFCYLAWTIMRQVQLSVFELVALWFFEGLICLIAGVLITSGGLRSLQAKVFGN